MLSLSIDIAANRLLKKYLIAKASSYIDGVTAEERNIDVESRTGYIYDVINSAWSDNIKLTKFAETWVGNSKSWFSGAPHSEFQLGNPYDAFKTLLDMALPSFGVKIPKIHLNASETNYNNIDRVFFVNGILTSTSVAKRNCKRLADLLKKDINLISNPTDGFSMDFAEVVRGKCTSYYTDEAIFVAAVIEEELKKNVSVKLIGHSQGTIICTNAVRILEENKVKNLKNLSVHLFATCADDDSRKVYVEHFVNTNDFVANLGVLNKTLPKFNGKVFKSDKTGHLLCAHYLNSIEDYFKDKKKSRLFHSA